MAYRELYLTPGAVAAYNFPDRQSGMAWTAGASNLKSTMSNVHGLESQEARDLALHRWLEDAESFRVQWGDIMVPQDIQTAVNSVQERLGLPLTQYDHTPVQGLPNRG